MLTQALPDGRTLPKQIPVLDVAQLAGYTKKSSPRPWKPRQPHLRPAVFSWVNRSFWV